MRLRITDLLDEYMYDDIPLDPVETDDIKQLKETKKTGVVRFGRVVAAAVITLCVVGAFYLGGTGTGKSLGAGEGQEEAVTSEGDFDLMESLLPESIVVSDAPDVSYGATSAPVPSVPPTAEPAAEAQSDNGAPDESPSDTQYSQVISIVPGGTSVTLTDVDGTVIWGIGDLILSEKSVSFTLTYTGDEKEPVVVGSEEQLRLGKAAEPDAQFFLIDGITESGTACYMSNPQLIEMDEEYGHYYFEAQWLQWVYPDEIKEIYLRKAKMP